MGLGTYTQPDRHTSSLTDCGVGDIHTTRQAYLYFIPQQVSIMARKYVGELRGREGVSACVGGKEFLPVWDEK